MTFSLAPVRLHRAHSQVVEPSQAAPAEPGGSESDVPSLTRSEGGQPTSRAALLSTHYASADELDQGPGPQPGWLLDESAFPAGRETKLLVRLWVAAEGRIDRIELVHADPPGEWASRAIEPLMETKMSAPIRDGRAVPAVIVVEIAAQDEGFH